MLPAGPRVPERHGVAVVHRDLRRHHPVADVANAAGVIEVGADVGGGGASLPGKTVSLPWNQSVRPSGEELFWKAQPGRTVMSSKPSLKSAGECRRWAQGHRPCRCGCRSCRRRAPASAQANRRYQDGVLGDLPVERAAAGVADVQRLLRRRVGRLRASQAQRADVDVRRATCCTVSVTGTITRPVPLPGPGSGRCW